MKKYKLTLILIFLLPVLPAVQLDAVEVEYPLLQSMVYFPYSDNTVLEKGKIEGAVDFYYSNFYRFNHERTFFSDFESFSTVLGFRYGLTGNGTIECYMRHTAIFGGTLDKFIEDFHSAFGLPDADRPLYSRNEVRYYLWGLEPGAGFTHYNPRSAMISMVLAYLARLHRSAHWGVKARLAIGAPLSNEPGLSAGTFSVTGGVIVDYRKKWFHAGFSNHVALIGSPNWLEGADMRKTLWYSRLELRAFRVIAGFNFRTSAFKRGIPSANAYQVIVGYQISKRLAFIFQEDFAPFNTTPDIGFNVRWQFL